MSSFISLRTLRKVKNVRRCVIGSIIGGRIYEIQEKICIRRDSAKTFTIFEIFGNVPKARKLGSISLNDFFYRIVNSVENIQYD